MSAGQTTWTLQHGHECLYEVRFKRQQVSAIGRLTHCVFIIIFHALVSTNATSDFCPCFL